MIDDIRFIRNRTGRGYIVFKSYGSHYFVAKGMNRLVPGKYKHRCRTVKKVGRTYNRIPEWAIEEDLKKIYVKSLLYDHGVGGII